MIDLLNIYNEAKAIVESDLSWEAKYDLIFSERISRAFGNTATSFTYYDPDTSYEEDVMAWFNAAHDYLWVDNDQESV